MNAFDLESVHFQSSNGTDLTVGIADKAIWESAGSKNEKGVFFLPNIPTEEVFTAPHKEKVNGIVYGTKPYVFNGQLIKGFHVTFKDGKRGGARGRGGRGAAGPAPGAPMREHGQHWRGGAGACFQPHQPERRALLQYSVR